MREFEKEISGFQDDHPSYVRLPEQDACGKPNEIPDLPNRCTLNGDFDAYCHVCWNPVYALWIDEEDPCGECMYGHQNAIDCPDALKRARTTADVLRMPRETPPASEDDLR
jgi:hypothetical protein